MPFDLGFGETVLTLVGLLLVYALPLAALVWAMFAMRRLQRSQTELLARLTAIERRLGATS